MSFIEPYPHDNSPLARAMRAAAKLPPLPPDSDGGSGHDREHDERGFASARERDADRCDRHAAGYNVDGTARREM